MIKIGLYGCGGRTRGMIDHALKHNVGCEVALCYDINQTNADLTAKRFNGRVCGKEELLRSDEIDMILISLYPAAHPNALLETVETGKPIYIEKPVATSRSEFRRLAPLAERNDVHIHVGSMCGNIPIYKQLASLVEKGTIGKLISGSFHWASRRDFIPERDILEKGGTWRHARETGGELTQHLCHYFGWMRAVAGDFESIIGMSNQFDDNQSVIEDTWNLIIKFRNGVLFDVKQTERDQSHTVLGSLEGTTGSLHWEWQWDNVSRIVHYGHTDDYSKRVVGKQVFEGATTWEDPLRNFIDRFVNGQAPSVTLADGLWSVAPAILARESFAEGKILRFPEKLCDF